MGLLGSALTCLFSWMTLFFFNGHKVINGGYLPKPAAWLSVILSLNGILVHMAVSQGVAVSWWYRASREQATVAELHNIWATGSSIASALTSWKAFNYIALATAFVATLPINGILLQNAVTSGVNYKNITKESISFAIASSLPAGFSADLNGDGSVGQYNPLWQAQIPFAIANAEGVYKTFNDKNSCKGDCMGTVEGVGFQESCTESTIPYDLPSDKSSNTTVDSTMFSVDIAWNVSAPNTLGLNTIYKPSDACTGEYVVKNCTLQMAKVKYPVQVQYNATGDEQWYWYMMQEQLTPSHRSSVYYPSEVVELYPVIQETNTTIFGGIASALESYYDSSIVLHPTRNGTALKVDGLYAQQIQTYVPGYNEDGTPITLPNKCNTSFTTFGYYGNPTDLMLDSIRTTMFYTSIFQALQDQNSVQTLHQSPEWDSVSEYHVLWKYWGASVAVTLCIVLFILPTFYGFWTLARKTTLSPLETARAFHAPVLREAPGHLDIPGLLKEVGGKNLHTDLHTAGTPQGK